MMKKRWKQGGALILAAVLVISAFVIPKAFAAIGVDVDAECKLTVDATGTGYKELTNFRRVSNSYVRYSLTESDALCPSR